MQVREVRLSEFGRVTAKRKAEMVLEILSGKLALIDFCRSNDLTQSEVQTWIDQFVQSGTQGLKVNPKDKNNEYEKQIHDLKHVIGDQALEIRVLKKSIEIQEREESKS